MGHPLIAPVASRLNNSVSALVTPELAQFGGHRVIQCLFLWCLCWPNSVDTLMILCLLAWCRSGDISVDSLMVLACSCNVCAGEVP